MSNALLKSINTAPAKLLLSMDDFHISSMDIRTVFLYPLSEEINARLYAQNLLLHDSLIVLDTTGRPLISL